jgi:hypothetical protein
MKALNLLPLFLLINTITPNVLKPENKKNYSQKIQNMDETQIYLEILKDWQNDLFTNVKTYYIDKDNNKLPDIPDRNNFTSEQTTEKPLLPGAVLNVSFELTDYVKDQIVNMLYEQFKDFTLPTEIETTDLTFSKMNIKLQNLLPKNVDMYLIEKDNSLYLRFTNLYFEMNSNIVIHKYFFSKSGTIKVRALIPAISIKLFLLDERDKVLKKPKFRAQMIEFLLPTTNLIIKLELDWIPNFITDLIIYFVNNMLIELIKDFVEGFIWNEGTAKINEQIDEGFPGEISILDEDLMISLYLTNMLTVHNNRLIIEADGQCYQKSKSKGPRDIPSRISFNESDTEGLVMGISQELIQCILVVLFADINKNKYIIDSDTVKAELKSNISKDSFVISEKGMALHEVLFEGTVEYWGYNLDVKFKLNSGLNIDTFDFFKKKVMFSITNVDLFDFEFKSNTKFIQAFGPYVKSLIEAFGQFFHNYSLPIPKIELPYNILLDAAIFRSQDGFTVLKVDSHQEL